MLKIIANKDKSIEYKEDNGKIYLNNKLYEWSISKIDNGNFHAIHDDRSYCLEIIEADFSSKILTLRVNGRKVELKIKDKFDALLEKLGINETAASKINEIKAPMPGLILEVKMKEGDSVKTGDTLLILEAMKMENVIKSPGDGTIKSIKIKKGDSVEKNQTLIQF
ncbi:MAG TPA: acetyl-CoA carboxylase biotin carboxyl carrier protein subunit [Cytophagaceae bacterium]|nr:acetyl-CoA carboxylase biotin carboxyl carrier protein subunit [Cytophagaceae bacterium]